MNTLVKRMLALALLIGSLVPWSMAQGSADEQLQKASTLAQQGQTAQAKALLNQLIQNSPSQPEPYNNLAVLEAQQGETEAAQALLQKALRTQKSCATSYDNLNKINQHLALRSYQKSLALKASEELPSLALANRFQRGAAEVKVVERVVERVVEKPVEVIREVERIVEVPQACPESQPPPVIDTRTAEPQSYPLPKNFVTRWAQAWSAQNVRAYIDFYTQNFSHGPNKTHTDWVNLRRQRLSAPSFIRVKAEQVTLKRLGPQSAIAQFIQDYRSNTINDSINKALVLVVENQQWKIAEELSLR